MRTLRSWPLAILVWTVLGSSACAQTTSKPDDGGSPTAAVEGGHNVGFTVLEAKAPGADGKQKTIDVAVWYPSADAAVDTTYDYTGNEVATRLSREGKALSGKYPLILYSHGATGCGLSMAFLTERLASKGYVVAAPDYTDKFYGARIEGRGRVRKVEQLRMLKWMKDLKEHNLNKGGKAYRYEKLAYRPKQAQAAIDRLLEESAAQGTLLSGIVDGSAVGVVGHSFGAWTSLLIGGADPTFADDRVKAVAALSGPCNDSVYEPDELGNIDVPVLFMFGGEEPGAGRMDDEKLMYDRVKKAPKILLEIKGADHFTFSGGIRAEFSSTGGYLRQDPRRTTIVDYVVAFFQSTLKKDKAGRKFLESKAPGIGKHVVDL